MAEAIECFHGVLIGDQGLNGHADNAQRRLNHIKLHENKKLEFYALVSAKPHVHNVLENEITLSFYEMLPT